MATDTAAPSIPILRATLGDHRRALVGWSIALAIVSAIYTSFWPAMGSGEEYEALIATMPEALVKALGYDQIGTAAGYLASTVYDLLGPVLLLVFALGTGARLIAGHEEDGTLELELTSPVPRRQIYLERLAMLWTGVITLVVVLTVVTSLLVSVLDMDVAFTNLLAGSAGLGLLVLGLGTIAFAVGAATGRRSMALAIAAGLAVLAYLFNAIGPAADLDWMSRVSPFGWYTDPRPLLNGVDVPSLLQLAAIPLVAAAAGLWRFRNRDLMV